MAQPLVGAGGGGGGDSFLQNERQVVRKAGRQAIRQFLEQHNCFSVLRASGKVVVFDTRIPVQLAFYALVEHGTFEGEGCNNIYRFVSLSILVPG